MKKNLTKEQQRVSSLISQTKPFSDKSMHYLNNSLIVKDNIQRAYFMQIERKAEYQIFRYFDVKNDRRRKSDKITSVNEVFRIYANMDNHKVTIVAKKFNALSSIYSSFPVFSLGSDFEVRSTMKHYYNYYSAPEYYTSYCYDSCVKSWHPMMYRLGLTRKKLTQVSPYNLLCCLLGKDNNLANRVETLLKNNILNAVRYVCGNGLNDDLWGAIKISLRRNYDLSKIEKFSDYADYINILKQLNIDTHNDKYVCPQDFKLAHQKANQKLAIEREKKNKLVRIAEDRRCNEEYTSRMQKFFDLIIKCDDIEIRPLRSIEEFYQEGEKMHHCVYNCRYFDKKTSLILSARKAKETIETIEFDILEGKVLQSRGHCNQITDYHEKIIQAVENNFRTMQHYVA